MAKQKQTVKLKEPVRIRLKQLSNGNQSILYGRCDAHGAVRDAGEAMRRLERHIGGIQTSPLSPSGFSSSRLGKAIQNCSALAPQCRFIGKNPIPQRSPSIIIERVWSLENPALLTYLTERGIDLDTARGHCSEVHYRSSVR